MIAPSGSEQAAGQCGIQIFPQCLDCLFDLARTAAEMAAGSDPQVKARAEEAAAAVLAQAETSGLTSPEVANRMLRAMRRETGVADPYSRFKVEEMAQARSAFEKAMRLVGQDLRSRLSLAVLGNSLDFFRPADEALAEVASTLSSPLRFFHDDSERLESYLSSKPGLILYLTDNAGEVYFDLLLYDYLRQRAGRLVLIVKGGPALNDLTRADLERAGLSDRFDEVADTGTDGAGVDWENVSTAFLALLEKADLVLAKGMANFETLYPRPLPGPTFFLFKVKCIPIKDYLKAPPESYWALWREGNKAS